MEHRQLGFNPHLRDQGTYDADLHHDRRQNQHKLKRRFEHLFAKYERDFAGIGDEIDIQTGDIVVDNGHIQNMRHEGDTGARSLHRERLTTEPLPEDESYSATEVTSLQESDRFESELASDADWLDDTAQRDMADDDLNNSGWNLGHSSLPDEDEDEEQDELTFDERFCERVSSVTPAPFQHFRSCPALTLQRMPYAPPTTGANLFQEIPAFRDSMRAFERQASLGLPIDSSAIAAFGMNITAQLSTFVSQNFQQIDQRRHRASVKNGHWSFPLLPGDRSSVRRGSRPSQRAPTRLPALLSPTRASLWAPPSLSARPRKISSLGRPQPVELMETDEISSPPEIEEDSNSPPSVRPIEQSSPDPLQTCLKCGGHIEDSWSSDKGEEDLCDTCSSLLFTSEDTHPVAEPLMEEQILLAAGSPPNDKRQESRVAGDEVLTQTEPEPDDRQPTPHMPNTKKIRRRSGPGSKRPPRRWVHFSTAEDVLLIRLKEVEGLSWEEIAEHIPERTSYAAQCRYSKKLRGSHSEARQILMDQGYIFEKADDGSFVAPTPKGPFTEDEDALLLKLCTEDGLNWDDIAIHLGGRGPLAVECRFNELLTGLVNGGAINNSSVAGVQPKAETDKGSTRTLKHYTLEEDHRLLRLRDEGKTWMEMGQYFPGRSPASLQKHFKRDLETQDAVSRQAAIAEHHANHKDVSEGKRSRKNDVTRLSAENCHTTTGKSWHAPTVNLCLDPSLMETSAVATQSLPAADKDGILPHSRPAVTLPHADASIAEDTPDRGLDTFRNPDSNVRPSVIRAGSIAESDRPLPMESRDSITNHRSTYRGRSAPQPANVDLTLPIRSSTDADSQLLDPLSFSLEAMIASALRSSSDDSMTPREISKWIGKETGRRRRSSISIRKELNSNASFEKVGRSRPSLWRLVGPACDTESDLDEEIIVVAANSAGHGRDNESNKRSIEKVVPSKVSSRKRYKQRSSSDERADVDRAPEADTDFADQPAGGIQRIEMAEESNYVAVADDENSANWEDVDDEIAVSHLGDKAAGSNTATARQKTWRKRGGRSKQRPHRQSPKTNGEPAAAKSQNYPQPKQASPSLSGSWTGLRSRGNRSLSLDAEVATNEPVSQTIRATADTAPTPPENSGTVPSGQHSQRPPTASDDTFLDMPATSPSTGAVQLSNTAQQDILGSSQSEAAPQLATTTPKTKRSRRKRHTWGVRRSRASTPSVRIASKQYLQSLKSWSASKAISRTAGSSSPNDDSEDEMLA